MAKAELLLRHEDLKLDFPQGFSVTDWERETFPVKGITLLSNSVAAKNKASELWYAVCQIMKEAQEIVIQTPYIICNQHMYKKTVAWCAGKKRVRIVTNAAENGVNPFGCTEYLNQKNRILRSGTEVYEYLGEQSLHIKTILMDQNISFTGSLNLDMRSVYLNTETILLIDCPQMNEQLNKRMESITAFCKHILPGGAATHGKEYKGVSWSFAQHIRYSILRIILIPMRHLL